MGGVSEASRLGDPRGGVLPRSCHGGTSTAALSILAGGLTEFAHAASSGVTSWARGTASSLARSWPGRAPEPVGNGEPKSLLLRQAREDDVASTTIKVTQRLMKAPRGIRVRAIERHDLVVVGRQRGLFRGPNGGRPGWEAAGPGRETSVGSDAVGPARREDGAFECEHTDPKSARSVAGNTPRELSRTCTPVLPVQPWRSAAHPRESSHLDVLWIARVPFL